MFPSIPYLPGSPPSRSRPLARFLPPIPSGVAAFWLARRLSKDEQPVDLSAGQGVPWILDPFGTAPDLAVETARAGYRVLVSANNPVARFLLEMAADPPGRDELKAALADLASSRKGDERLEPHIRNLYLTECDECGSSVMAEAFLWERGAGAPAGEATGEGSEPFARVYRCPTCGKSGEFPATQSDVERAARFSASGLHRARALERVASRDDPDRQHVDEALSTYLPRAVYALFTLVNKLEAIPGVPGNGIGRAGGARRLLEALLLSAFDQANTLWPYPTGRARPRQLTIPPRFREKNIWLALEEAVEQWAVGDDARPPVPITVWPEIPPPEGGICLFEGRLKDLAEQVRAGQGFVLPARAALAALPRPNQAFWTLSALWAGWLWGREAVGPFKSVLHRRRYDWAWHSTALHAALDHMAPLLEPGAPFFGLIGEAEPGFLSAAAVAAQGTDFRLEGLALRPEEGQVQISWRQAPKKLDAAVGPASPATATAEFIAQAGQAYLKGRGEPASYLHLQAAAVTALLQAEGLESRVSPAETLNQLNSLLEDGFAYRRGFLRYGGGDKSTETGQWWLRETVLDRPDTAVAVPLADRVEMGLVSWLIKNPGKTGREVEISLCDQFPGLFTPEAGLVQACLASYAETAGGSEGWSLRLQELPKNRRDDLKNSLNALGRIAGRLGYKVEGKAPLLWFAPDGELHWALYLAASSVAGQILLDNPHAANQSVLVLPEERTGLLAYKLARDPRLRQRVEEGWRFISFHRLNWLVEHPSLDQTVFEKALTTELADESGAQMRLF